MSTHKFHDTYVQLHQGAGDRNCMYHSSAGSTDPACLHQQRPGAVYALNGAHNHKDNNIYAPCHRTPDQPPHLGTASAHSKPLAREAERIASMHVRPQRDMSTTVKRDQEPAVSLGCNLKSASAHAL